MAAVQNFLTQESELESHKKQGLLICAYNLAYLSHQTVGNRVESRLSVLQADLLVVSCDLVVADDDNAVQSLHALADIYRKHSAMVAMLVAPSVNFTDAIVTCPGGKHRRRIGPCVFCRHYCIECFVILRHCHWAVISFILLYDAFFHFFLYFLLLSECF